MNIIPTSEINTGVIPPNVPSSRRMTPNFSGADANGPLIPQVKQPSNDSGASAKAMNLDILA